MKKSLITLHTENEQALFDNIFNDEIIIEPNSEIAFHSCCLRLNNLAIKIDNTNKLVTLQIGTTAPMKHLIEPGEYGEHQIQYLLLEMQNSFNQLLNIENETDNGQQIRISYSKKKVVSIDLIKSAVSLGSVIGSGGYTKDPSLFLYGTEVVVDGATGRISRTSGSTNLGQGIRQFVHGRVPITRGCGFCSVNVTGLRGFAANVYDGCIMMITEESNPDKFQTRKNCLAYFRVPEKIGQGYAVATKEGNYVETHLAVVCNLGDVAQFEITEGKLFFVVYKTTEPEALKTRVLDFEFPVYDEPAENGITAPLLYMTAGILGPTFSGIINYMSDPYLATPPPNSLTLLDLDSSPPSFSKGNLYEHKLVFQKDDVATAFGFDDKELSVTDTDVCTFLAPQSIIKSTHPSNYKIELLNIQLESFDSQKEGRMNILSTIPTSKEFRDDRLSVLNFEPSNMFYLTIRNKQRLSLRNIRARVIDANNEPITLLGFSSINLLIKPSDTK